MSHASAYYSPNPSGGAPPLTLFLDGIFERVRFGGERSGRGSTDLSRKDCLEDSPDGLSLKEALLEAVSLKDCSGWLGLSLKDALLEAVSLKA